MAVVFQFTTDWATEKKGARPMAVKASREWVERFVRPEELLALYGGYIVWDQPAAPTKEMPGEALGVWGRDSVVRFKQLLRDRGATFRLTRNEGPGQVIKRIVTADDRR